MFAPELKNAHLMNSHGCAGVVGWACRGSSSLAVGGAGCIGDVGIAASGAFGAGFQAILQGGTRRGL